MSGKGLGEVLREIEELENKRSINIEDKNIAYSLIVGILETQGSAFILDILEEHGAGNIKKSHLIKGLYNKLNLKYPSLDKAKIREMVASHFKISDKAVQKHIYKSRKK